MNIADFFIIYFNNFKGNPFNLNKKDKINNLKTDIIMDNIAKIKKNNNLDFLNSESDPKHGNKHKRRFYNKKIIIKIKKYGSPN